MQQLRPGSRFLSYVGASLALAALSAVGCGDDGGPAAAPITSPITTPGGGTGGGLTGGGDSGVLPVLDSGATNPPPSSGDAGPAATGGGGTTGGGALSTDTPWCKAKEVLQRRCVTCHDGQATAGTPDKIAFNNLVDLLADSKTTPGSKYVQNIGTRIHDANRPMPPANDLSAADRAVLDAWVASGGAAGANPTCTSAAAGDAGVATGDGGAALGDGGVYNEPWPSDCEKHYKIQAHALNGALTDPYMVPKGQEVHDNIIFDAPWGDEEVQSVAMRPITDNKRVLHHWILYAAQGSAFITGWAPGAEDAAKLPDDVGLYVAKGKQSLRLNMHYYNREGTKDEPDQSGVEVCTVSKAKFRKHTASVFSSFGSLGKNFVLAPANAKNYETTGNCPVTTTEPVTLLTASPHAHTLAVGMRFSAKVGGKDVMMHDGPFVFEEQRSYALTPSVVLNTGDTVTTTCIFTNPTSKDVTFGENTGNEMCFNFAVYYPMGALSCGLDLTGLLDF